MVPEIIDGMFRDGGDDLFCELGWRLLDEIGDERETDESIAFFFEGMAALTDVRNGDRARTIRIFGKFFDGRQGEIEKLREGCQHLYQVVLQIYAFQKNVSCC